MNTNIEKINDSEKLEQTMKKVWSRNVFFICWYAIYFAITLVRASFNRICQIPRLVHNIVYRDNRAYVRKVSQHAWLEKWNLLVDSNYWMIIVAFVFFSLMTIFKLMYHFGKSFMFLWNNFIKTLLWMMVISSAAKSIGNGLSKRA